MKKKKILLLSDDLRMHSGIATVSKDIVMETLNEYDWVQLGGAIKHPDKGKVFDMSDGLKEFGIKDGYLRVYPVDGYGDEAVLREVMELEKPDAILHYTDPRFWIWLYRMEAEIRRNIPIFYYNIWDDLPDPQYNTDYYKSSDLLMSISKQTYGINNRLLPEYEDWQTTYVPHGISSRRFSKIEDTDDDLKEFNDRFGLTDKTFRVLYSNRNIRRKMPGDVALAFKYFVEGLPEEQRDDCVMIFHCSPSDANGTDLPKLCRDLMPECNVAFTYEINKGQPFHDGMMNKLFNSADVYVNMASNEGFGLGSAEALTVGTPIIVNMTGGMQDQCGVRDDEGNLLTPDDYIKLGSNHRGKYKTHGEWVKPVYPASISLQGSPPTPYIWDDRCNPEDVAVNLREFYDMGREERKRLGDLGTEFCKENQMTSEAMGQNFIDSMNGSFDKWKPRKRYTVEKV
jgi:glycosyltransferase involved in cell wall biosynthesis